VSFFKSYYYFDELALDCVSDDSEDSDSDFDDDERSIEICLNLTFCFTGLPYNILKVLSDMRSYLISWRDLAF
jgi:hypothetical protein